MDFDEILGKIKAYTDIAIDQAGKFGKAAATKTENAVSKAKVKYVINETEGQIYDIYAGIGEKVYQKFLEGLPVDEAFTEDCEKISVLNEELDALNAQLSDLRDIVKCDYCGAYSNTDSVFCPKCGAKLTKPEQDGSDDTEENASDSVIIEESDKNE